MIIYDGELDETLRLIDELAAAGVDALLVQDMGLVGKLSGSKLPPSRRLITVLPKRWQRQPGLGFQTWVLTFEVVIGRIAAIHRSVPDVELKYSFMVPCA